MTKKYKGKYIYWRWKKNGSRTLIKDFVQDEQDEILELTDNDFYTAYPRLILLKEIEIFKVQSPKQEE